jgi:predicted  nucleic acid-binding Zn-ribbon protein
VVSNYDAEADHYAERVATLERELEKADRRTAEQEGIIAKQREKIEALREALAEALDEWASWYEDQRHSGQPLENPRIVELRKLTEAP